MVLNQLPHPCSTPDTGFENNCCWYCCRSNTLQASKSSTQLQSLGKGRFYMLWPVNKADHMRRDQGPEKDASDSATDSRQIDVLIAASHMVEDSTVEL